MPRSAWRASSLLALSVGGGRSTAGASCAHCRRFARFGDRQPSYAKLVQFRAEAAYPGAARSLCLHRLHQCSSKYFRLTPPVSGGLRCRHENKCLCAILRENPGHHGLCGAGRPRRARGFPQRISGRANQPDRRSPDRQPGGSEPQHFRLDGCRSLAKRALVGAGLKRPELNRNQPKACSGYVSANGYATQRSAPRSATF